MERGKSIINQHIKWWDRQRSGMAVSPEGPGLSCGRTVRMFSLDWAYCIRAISGDG